MSHNCPSRCLFYFSTGNIIYNINMYWVLIFLKFRLEVMCQMLWMLSSWYCGNVGTVLVQNIYDLQEICQKKGYKLCVCCITKRWKALQCSGDYRIPCEEQRYLLLGSGTPFHNQFWRSHTVCMIWSRTYICNCTGDVSCDYEKFQSSQGFPVTKEKTHVLCAAHWNQCYVYKPVTWEKCNE
jgi:hypothetical protein